MLADSHIANVGLAALSNHQAVLLPSNQSQAYIKDLSWSDLHSMGQLAPYDRDHLCDCSIQQCKLLLSYYLF